MTAGLANQRSKPKHPSATGEAIRREYGSQIDYYKKTGLLSRKRHLPAVVIGDVLYLLTYCKLKYK
jgi:hypothetical protein